MDRIIAPDGASTSVPVGGDLLVSGDRATVAFVVEAGAASKSDGGSTPVAAADEELWACEVASLLFCLEPGLGPAHSATR